MGNFHPLEVVGRGNLLWWYVKDLFIRREIIILTRDQPNCHRSHSHFFKIMRYTVLDIRRANLPYYSIHI